jgi:hypothetical protein
MVPVPSLQQWFRYCVYNNGSGTESTTMVPVPSLQHWSDLTIGVRLLLINCSYKQTNADA